MGLTRGRLDLYAVHMDSDSEQCSSSRRSRYDCLCQRTRDEGGHIRLARDPQGFVVQVVLAPTGADPAWRASAVLLPSIAELDQQVGHLLAWVESCRAEQPTPQGKHVEREEQ